MAPIYINPLAAVTHHTGKITQYLRARAQQGYNEASLQIETKLRQSKEFLTSNISGKTYGEIGKAYNSYKILHNKKPLPPVQSISQHRGRIEKATTRPTNTFSEWYRRYSAERKHAENKRMAWYRDSQAQLASLAEPATFVSQQDSHPGLPKVPRDTPEPEPQVSYMDSLRISHPASEDAAERSKTVLASLASIPSMNNVTGVGAPSGHSGISNDPVLAKFNRERYTNHVLDLHYEYQAKQRAQWEEEQRRRDAAEAECQHKMNLLQHLCNKYDQRVAKLVTFGSKFNAEINKFEQGFVDGDLKVLCRATAALVNEIIEPAHAILQEMPVEIALETLGATELKEAWPLEKVDQILKQFTAANISVFDNEVQNMLVYMKQGFHAICAPILKAVPLADTLNEIPALPFMAKSIPVPFAHNLATVSTPTAPEPAPQQQKSPQSDSQQPAIEGPNAGKNFASFADLIKSNKQGQVPEITITPPSVSGSFLAGLAPTGTFTTTETSSDNTAPASSDDNKVQIIKQAISDKVLDFQDNVGKLVKDHSVKATPRKAIMDHLEWLDSYAQGETGLLASDECPVMKNEIRRLLIKIANLRDQKEKSKMSTRELDVLAHGVMKLWK